MFTITVRRAVHDVEHVAEFVATKG